MRGVISALEKLNHSTEADFLAVGGKLLAFLSAARELNAGIGGLAALVAGEQAQQACDALVQVRGYALEMQSRSEAGGRALLALQSGAERIHRGFGSFEQIATSFRATAALAKIEAARLAASQENLKSLAEDVRASSDFIKSRARQVLQAAGAFHARIASTLREFSRSDALQQRDLPALLAAVDDDLEIFKSRQAAAAGVSSKLSADLKSVTADLGNIAVAIQFHDITRQQVEHVVQALEGLLPPGFSAGGEDHGAGRGEAISSSGGALVRLQKAQLESAAAAFSDSTREIGGDLAGIGARVGEMAEASNRIQGFGQERNSFLGVMQSRFGAVAQAVTDLHTLERGTRATVADLKHASRDMRAAVGEVQSIESQLNLLAINGVVSATRLGAQGQVLIAIAGAIGELRRASAARSGDAEAALLSIGEAIGSLAGGGDLSAGTDNPAGDDSVDDGSGAILLENLNARARDLQSAIEACAGAAAKVAALANQLCANLEEARGHLAVGGIFAGTVMDCCRVLDRAASHAEPPGLDEPFEEDPSHQRYTMQTERDVHRAVRQSAVRKAHSEDGPEPEPEGGPEETGASEPAESPDDVEFF